MKKRVVILILTLVFLAGAMAAAGLPLVGERLHAEQTTTYGVGELMAHALERGCKRLVVGLGGSATNDGGCGAAAACIAPRK